MLNIWGHTQHKQYEQYKEALYQIKNFPDVRIRPGYKNPSIDDLLNKYQVDRGAIITPYNPRSKKLSVEENEAKLLLFKHQILQLGLPYLDTVSSDEQGDWLEYGVLVMGIDLIKAREIGREYEQNALIYMQSNSAPEVIWIR